MTEPVVQFTDVSKYYRRGAERANFRAAVPGRWGLRPPPNAHVALEGVSFELFEGEALGVIGPNGAGKSTMLKLLARISAPNRGRICTRGRIASLIELGVGFHPDLSGEENVRFSASLLGMTPSEVADRYDEIVEFAGIGSYMQMPVKRYSSGMLARLGFSVAAHVDADILVVDEALGVGDSQFQRRGYERIRELRMQGVSTVFVAHGMWMVSQLCDRVMFLDKGRVVKQGVPQDVIEEYAGAGASSGLVWGRAGAEIHDFSVDPSDIDPGDGFTLRAAIEVERPMPGCTLAWTLGVGGSGKDEWELDVPVGQAILQQPGRHLIEGRIEMLPISPGEFDLGLVLRDIDGGAPLGIAQTVLLVRGEASSRVQPSIPVTWETSTEPLPQRADAPEDIAMVTLAEIGNH